MLNDLDRFHLVIDVIDRVPGLGRAAAHLRQAMVDERLEARDYTREYGDDVPEVADWKVAVLTCSHTAGIPVSSAARWVSTTTVRSCSGMLDQAVPSPPSHV